MGGNLFDSKRICDPEYRSLWDELSGCFADVRATLIPSYRSKTSHGDMDILVEKPPGRGIREIGGELAARFGGVSATHRNGDVFSMLRNGFQIDLIFVAPEHHDFSLAYFSWNDLGNLVGRVAHAMGLKYGHKGLIYPVRRQTRLLGEVPLTLDPDAALAFLGYSPDRHHRGFDTLEEIFEFVCEGEWFSPALYPLEGRSHRARVRDRKRPTYMRFLRYLDEKRPAPRFAWPTDPVARAQFRDGFIKKALDEFPVARRKTEDLLAKEETRARARLKWNGNIARRLTGLDGRDLGEFMARFRKEACETGPGGFDEWIVRATPGDLRRRALQIAATARPEARPDPRPA